MKDCHDQNKKPSRWDQLPDKNVKRHQHGNKRPEESMESETTMVMNERTDSTGHRHERQHRRHDRSTGIPAVKSNGKDDKYHYERKPKGISGYMRAWDDDEETLNERPDKAGYHRKRDDIRHSRRDESSKFSERSDSYSVSGSRHDRRENDIVRFPLCSLYAHC
ncbi:hypothetical protein M378DRAFT_953369 [Amanita muscaria Koide BX008]|uniref:Uncharacterized protein n=1 Tax=Amanita muscaria (strain Koide BX008) TaxID=946122 RepID=A0A0C2WTT1_AMAMK|nr:hypothetical protein M378DRAFT_953369 [Amanita muscaria Koide BX008]